MAGLLVLAVMSLIGAVEAVRSRVSSALSMGKEIASSNGVSCTASVTKSGTCTGGKYCYTKCEYQLTSSMCRGSKSWLNQGECYIPRRKPCDGWKAMMDDECRPGTLCLDLDGSRSPTCESCGTTTSQHPFCARRAVVDAIARWRARFNITKRREDEDLTSATETTRQYHVFDVDSVSQGSPRLVLAAEAALAKPLKVVGKMASSRSGASFFKTEDEAFYVKGFERKMEYDNLCKLVKGLNEPRNSDAFMEVSDLPTTVTVPALSFPAFGKTEEEPTYWSIMPNAESVFRSKLARGRVFGSNWLNTVLLKSTFDTKPDPLISAARTPFLHRLRDLDFKFVWDAHTAMFMAALARDLQVLDTYELADYSWLVFEYDVSKNVVPSDGGWCFESAPAPLQNFKDTKTVLCFTIIDYALSMDGFLMSLESWILKDKWFKYGDKLDKYTQCLFTLAPSREELRKKTGYDAQVVTATQNGEQNTASKRGFASAIKITFEGSFGASDECFDYRAESCRAIGIAKPYNTRMYKDMYKGWKGKAKVVASTFCGFTGAESYRLNEHDGIDPYCLGYALQACLQSLGA